MAAPVVGTAGPDGSVINRAIKSSSVVASPSCAIKVAVVTVVVPTVDVANTTPGIVLKVPASSLRYTQFVVSYSWS